MSLLSRREKMQLGRVARACKSAIQDDEAGCESESSLGYAATRSWRRECIEFS